MKIEHLIMFDSMGHRVIAHDKNVDFCFASRQKTVVEAPAIINECFLDCRFVGGYTFINHNATIRNVDSIGRFCSIAPNVVIGVSSHPAYALTSSNYFYWNAWSNISSSDEYDRVQSWHYLDEYQQRHAQASFAGMITIGNDVWIGQGAYVMNNITIGDGAIIGTGAVVTHDVEPYTIVAGVPARPIKKRFTDDIIERLMKIRWWDQSPSIISGLDFTNVDHKLLDELEKRIREQILLSDQKEPNIRFEFDQIAQTVLRIENNKSVLLWDNKAHMIEKGTISGNSIYNCKTHELNVAGWALPSYAYNKVEVYVDDAYISDGNIYRLRADVRNGFPDYADSRSGYQLTAKIDYYPEPKTVKVVCKKDDATTGVFKKEIQIIREGS